MTILMSQMPRGRGFLVTFTLMFILQYILLTSTPLLDNFSRGGPSKEAVHSNPWILLFVKNPFIFVALIALTSFVAAIFYVRYVIPIQASHSCRLCGGKMRFYHHFWHCPHCDSFCEYCGQAVADEAVKCPYCGAEFESTAPSATTEKPKSGE